MPENDLELLERAARAAGEIAISYWRQSPKTWDKDAGLGPVTEADLAIDDMLHATLLPARSHYGWLSEESDTGTDRLKKSRTFIIDPIDGTRAFIAGEETWSHSLAIIKNGMITSAVVYLPVRDELYSATQGGGAFLNGRKLSVAEDRELDGATVLSSKANFKDEYWNGGVPHVLQKFRPSLAYRLALVAQGRYDAMLTLWDTFEWDVAAGSLIAAEAGAVVSDRLGDPPVFNKKHPVMTGYVAASERLHAQLVDRLK